MIIMRTLRPFIAGVVTAALAYILSPGIRKKVKPVLEKSIEKGRERMVKIRMKDSDETIEDVSTGEQSYERELEKLKEENKTYLEEIRELKNLVSKLFDEIASLKGKN
jgi:predicted RNase H-like nuclease (RuvC/YqgF family)